MAGADSIIGSNKAGLFDICDDYLVVAYPDAEKGRGMIIFYDLQKNFIVKKMVPNDFDLASIGERFLKVGRLREGAKT